MGGPEPDKNAALRGLLDEAEMSNTALASAVVAAGGREGIHLGTSSTTVRRMLDGCRPHWPTPRLVAAVLSTRLQREVSVNRMRLRRLHPARRGSLRRTALLRHTGRHGPHGCRTVRTGHAPS
ncbi:MAG: hypothetical protein ACRDTC_08650 [Pseudonocardiaceae bacterium]